MSLSPELQRYCKTEGIIPDQLSHDIRQLRRSNRREKKRPQEAFVDGIFKSSEKTVQGFFKGVTAIRTHKPSLMPMFPWEQYYLQKYGAQFDNEDPTNARMWREYKDEGMDAKHMYTVYLQDHLVVPQHTLERLADQATTEKNQKSWLDFNKEIQTVLGEWVDRRHPAAIAQGIAKGILSSVPQYPDSALALLGGGTVASHLYAKGFARREDIGNHLSRMAGEFSSLLQVHYRTHERSLAHWRGIPLGDIDQVSERIFTGSRHAIESKTTKTEAKAIATGVTVAQSINVLNVGSLQELAIKLLGPTFAAAYLFRRIRKERSGDTVKQYIADQNDLLSEAQRIKRLIASDRSGSLALDLNAETDLGERRRALVGSVQKSRVHTKGAIEKTPWYLALGTTLADYTADVPPGVGSLITGGIIVSALSSFDDEFTRLRTDEVRKIELGHLVELIDEIELSEHRIPTRIERTAIMDRYKFQEIETREEVLDAMRNHALIIAGLDNGAVMNRKVLVDKPIFLFPGISFVNAPSGTGKSEFLRMIALEQGNIARIQITMGADFREIRHDLLPEIVTLVEAVPQSTETTIAEQMVPFVMEKGDNAFKDALRGLENDKTISHKYGRHSTNNVLNRLFTEHYQRQALLQIWVQEPSFVSGSVAGLANTLLNTAFMKVIQSLIPSINTPEEAAAYLQRKPGASKGTSTGEAQRWELCKALLKERAVLLLDEPTGNLDSHEEDSSLDHVANSLIAYKKRYPHTVILIATNDRTLQTKLIEASQADVLQQRFPLVDKLIQADDTGQSIIWRAEPLIV